jgi:hypothetical protein
LAWGRASLPDRRVEAVAGPAQAPETLDHDRRPGGDVACQLLEDFEGALAPAVVDGLGHVEAPGLHVQVAHQVGADEVPDVREHPAVAGLDVLVVPQPVDAAAHHRNLRADAVHELAEGTRRAKAVGVDRAVDAGQQLPQPLGVVRVETVVDDAGGGLSHRGTHT